LFSSAGSIALMITSGRLTGVGRYQRVSQLGAINNFPVVGVDFVTFHQENFFHQFVFEKFECPLLILRILTTSQPKNHKETKRLISLFFFTL
jgi:hypothetical protein